MQTSFTGQEIKLKEVKLRLDIRKTFFSGESGETVAEIAQRGGKYPIPENVEL